MPVIEKCDREEKRTLPAFNPFILAALVFMFSMPACNGVTGRDTPPPAAGAVTDYSTFSYDTANNLVQKVSFVPSGADSSRAPTRETIKSYFNSVYDSFGRLVQQVRYDGPGRDAVWFTPDDDIDYYRATTYDAAGNISRETVFDGPGTDKTWFAADDNADYTTSFIYDSGGRLNSKIAYDGQGTDGAWFTADDRVASFSRYDYDETGKVVRETRYYDPGPDKTWFTADDLISFSTTFTFDNKGNVLSEIRYDSPGPSGEWLAAEDGVGAIATYTYDADNRRTNEIRYYGAGKDDEWFTGDDAVLLSVTSTYDASGKKTREDEYDGPGPDTTWSTPDDHTAFFTVFDYNTDNTLARQTRYRTTNLQAGAIAGSPPSIGVFYYPGWSSTFNWWNDIKGLPGSRSPGVAWPDRIPLLGYYLEEQTWVAEKHIEWAARYGITFFAYDWYWDGTQPAYDSALQSHIRAANRDKLEFSILWANHFDIPRTRKEFDDMVSYWITHYFNQPNFYTVNGTPVVFLYSNDQLDQNARTFGETAKSLLTAADAAAKKAGFAGIYFILTTNARPADALEHYLADEGYSAYTGWNYVTSVDASPIADYSSMVDTYLDFYAAAATTNGKLPYIATASPGWDARPWQGSAPFAYVRENSTPEKFEKMLVGARSFMDGHAQGPNILMIEAWNEFGEGAYLEPTRRWDMKYLEALKNVFGEETR